MQIEVGFGQPRANTAARRSLASKPPKQSYETELARRDSQPAGTEFSHAEWQRLCARRKTLGVMSDRPMVRRD